MFIAMNNFRVAKGRQEDFERAWKTRETYLEQVPGIIRFALLKGDQEGEYISHSTWASREAFIDWTKSESFAAGHRQGSLAGVLEGPPMVKLYQAVIEEDFRAPARA